MKICSRCGAQLPDEAVFCNLCGANMNANAQQPQSAYQQNVSPNQPQDYNPYNPQGYAPNQQQGYNTWQQQGFNQNPQQGYNPNYNGGYQQPPYYVAPPPAPKSMKWFKFLVNFALFAGAIVNLATGIFQFTGMIYELQSNGEITADWVYSIYGMKMQLADIVYGAILMIFAAAAIYVRFRLSGFKKDGPMCFYIYTGAAIAVSVLYSIATVIIVTSVVDNVDVSGLLTSLMPSILFNIAMLSANIKYFNNRKEMFVN